MLRVLTSEILTNSRNLHREEYQLDAVKHDRNILENKNAVDKSKSSYEIKLYSYVLEMFNFDTICG